jgi:RNA polymerase sigma-70 factor, ECF subfamily
LNAPTDDQCELIGRAQAGDTTAFQRLVECHAARLWRCALAMSKDTHWSEDLAQETLIEAWRSLARFDGRCQFSTWLYGILRHRFLKGRRNQAAARLSTSNGVLDKVPCASHTPDHCAETSEDADRIRQAVDSLSEEHRLVVELRFFAAATLDEIAAALGCPLGTVKSRLHHGLEKLRRMNLAVNLFTSAGEEQERKV